MRLTFGLMSLVRTCFHTNTDIMYIIVHKRLIKSPQKQHGHCSVQRQADLRPAVAVC